MKNTLLLLASSGLMLFATVTFASGSAGHVHGKPDQHKHTKKRVTTIHDIEVTSKGFEPGRIMVKSGEEVVLRVTRKVKATCAKKISIPSKNIVKDLPLNKPVLVSFTAGEKGEIAFGCAMEQMLSGVVVVN